MARSHIADKVRSIMAKRRLGTGKLGNVVAGKPKASGQDNRTAPVDSKEYVLPQEFVDKVGADNIDKAVMQTLGQVQPPSGSVARGFREGGRGEGNFNPDAGGYGYWGTGVYDDWGSRIEGATPSWYTPRGGQGPETYPYGEQPPRSDDNIEPPPLPKPTPGPQEIYGGNEDSYNRAMLEIRDQFEPKVANWYSNFLGGFGGFGYQPPAGTPGFLQGSTLHPSYFDSQGYPYASPGNAAPPTSDNPYGGGAPPKTAPRKMSS